MKALFVRDEADALVAAEAASRAAGFDVDHSTLTAARRADAAAGYQLVLVDAELGIGAVKGLIARYAHAPVVVMGPAGDDPLGRAFLEAGCSDFVSESELSAERMEQIALKAMARHRGRIAFSALTDERVRRLQLMQTLFGIISQRDLSTAEQIERFLRSGCELFHMDLGVVSYIEGGIFVVEHVHSCDGTIKPGQQFRLSETFSAIALRARGPIGIHDLERSPWREHPCRRLGFKAYLGVPISVKGRSYGTLGFSGREPRSEPFSQWGLELIATLGDWMGTLLTHSQMLGELRLAATYDALTGLPNRRVFLSKLQRSLEHLRYSDQSTFALLFLDLDDFKFVNDTLGHLAGDELLAQVARRLEAHTMPKDTLARYAGDEFVVLLEDVTVAQAELVARRIRTSFEEPFTLSQGEARVGASIGIAPHDLTDDLQELIRAADAAMYRAKQSAAGVCVAEAVPEHPIAPCADSSSP